MCSMTRITKYDSYDDNYKATAVALSDLPRTKATDIAKILDIHPVMLYRWKKELTDGYHGKERKKHLRSGAEERVKAST